MCTKAPDTATPMSATAWCTNASSFCSLMVTVFLPGSRYVLDPRGARAAGGVRQIGSGGRSGPPGRWLGRLVAAGQSGADGGVEVGAQRRVPLVDAGDAVADACGDGLAGPFGV